jgi:acetyl-CoA carboxylase biotin carboxyl carrier protein
MDAKEIQELLKLVNRLELAEFRYKQGDLELTVKSRYFAAARAAQDAAPAYIPVPQVPVAAAPVSTPAAAAPRPSAEAPAPAAVPAEGGSAAGNLIEIRSPIVGTFYRSSSPEKPPFVKPGDMITAGTVVCIIEAMKLFNEIESEVSGKLVKVLVDDASPVEYDQLLFLIDPNG